MIEWQFWVDRSEMPTVSGRVYSSNFISMWLLWSPKVEMAKWLVKEHETSKRWIDEENKAQSQTIGDCNSNGRHENNEKKSSELHLRRMKDNEHERERHAHKRETSNNIKSCQGVLHSQSDTRKITKRSERVNHLMQERVARRKNNKNI